MISATISRYFYSILQLSILNFCWKILPKFESYETHANKHPNGYVAALMMGIPCDKREEYFFESQMLGYIGFENMEFRCATKPRVDNVELPINLN